MKTDDHRERNVSDDALDRVQALNDAEQLAMATLESIAGDVLAAGTPDKTHYDEMFETFANLSTTMAKLAPRSADLSAAERCLRLARIWFKEGLIFGGASTDRAYEQLRVAIFWAIEAVELADPSELPKLGLEG